MYYITDEGLNNFFSVYGPSAGTWPSAWPIRRRILSTLMRERFNRPTRGLSRFVLFKDIDDPDSMDSQIRIMALDELIEEGFVEER